VPSVKLERERFCRVRLYCLAAHVNAKVVAFFRRLRLWLTLEDASDTASSFSMGAGALYVATVKRERLLLAFTNPLSSAPATVTGEAATPAGNCYLACLSIVNDVTTHA